MHALSHATEGLSGCMGPAPPETSVAEGVEREKKNGHIK